MADKRIFDLTTIKTVEDLDEHTWIWMDKKAPVGEPQEPSWKVRGDILKQILDNFATHFVPNVMTVVDKCYWHDGLLYKCITEYSGVWISGNFVRTSVDELFTRKDVLSALTTYSQNVAASIASPFDPTRTYQTKYLAGERVMVGGSLFEFDADHYGVWTGDDAHKVDINEVLKKTVDESNAAIENKLSVFGKSLEYNEDSLYVVDAAGNVICKIDADGVTSTKFNGENLALDCVLKTYDDAFYITDLNGNVIFKADATGIYGLNIDGGGSVARSPYKDKVMISIGDSLSASGQWQSWLTEWLGMQFDQEVNHDGKDGHAAMAVGGTAIMPTEGSIYIRALDAHYYNPDVIFVYAGQNDIPYFGDASSVTPGNLGSIDDVPYTKDVAYTELPQSEWSDYTSFYQGMPTFYSRAMGLVEKLLTSCPTARMFILTPMQMWTTDGTQSVSRKALDTAWKEIGAKYSIPVISLWYDSCVNKFNASNFYPGANNVHPTATGYKRLAETIYTHL